MSSVIIAGNTSGTITLDAPAVAGTTTLTLPTTSGTIVTSANINSNLPAGSVLQVVNAVTSTLNATTGGTLIDTNLTASITPSSSSNKILVLVNQFGGKDGNCAYKIRLLRDSTDIGGADYIMFTNTVNSVQGFSYSFAVLDTPSTTSSTTYKTQFMSAQNIASVGVMNDNSTAVMILMEIAA